MAKQGIAVAGNMIVDKLNLIDAYPAAGQLVQIRGLDKSVGGCVPNVALDLKTLKPELPVWALGCIGRDAEGTYLKQTLQKGGVDISALTEVDETTSFTDVMSIVGGQRTFFTYPGASDLFGFEHVPFDAISPKMLHLGYFLLLKTIDEGDGLRILQEASSRGIYTSIDLVSESSDRYDLVLPCLPFVDALIINEFEASKLTGLDPEEDIALMAKKLLDLGVRDKVIIHKPEMAVCCSREQCTVLGSYILPEGFIQGTTGAGDAFCSGALLGLYQELPAEELLSFAAACAVMALRSSDATSGLKSAEETVAFCKTLERRTV